MNEITASSASVYRTEKPQRLVSGMWSIPTQEHSSGGQQKGANPPERLSPKLANLDTLPSIDFWNSFETESISQIEKT
ncbi:MAG: hypothetical protein WBG18_25620 [Xanthobacteraceae bacterium]